MDTNNTTAAPNLLSTVTVGAHALTADSFIAYQPAPGLDWHTAYVADNGRVWCLEASSAWIVFLDAPSISVSALDLHTLDSSDIDLARAVQGLGTEDAATRVISIRN